MKLYVLTAGEYDDYHVEAVVSTDREITEEMWENLWLTYTNLSGLAFARADNEASAQLGPAARDTRGWATDAFYQLRKELEKKYEPKVEKLVEQAWGVKTLPCIYLHGGS